MRGIAGPEPRSIQVFMRARGESVRNRPTRRHSTVATAVIGEIQRTKRSLCAAIHRTRTRVVYCPPPRNEMKLQLPVHVTVVLLRCHKRPAVCVKQLNRRNV